MVSCLIGILFKSIESPTPASSASSHNAVKIPPSETSCMALTLDFIATAASETMDVSFSKDFASSKRCLGSLSCNSSSFSFAKMAVPSRPTHFVITTS